MMKHNRTFKLLIGTVLIVAVFVATGLFSPTLAIGPGTGGSKIKVDSERIGPYVLLMATSPLPVTVGQMSVWVRVTGAADDQLRRDADVTVVAKLRGSNGPLVTAKGSHKNAGNDYDYVAHLDIDQAGQWDVTVTVVDDLGEAEAVFTEAVSRGRSAQGLVLIAIPFVLGIVGVGIYLWRRSANPDEGRMADDE